MVVLARLLRTRSGVWWHGVAVGVHRFQVFALLAGLQASVGSLGALGELQTLDCLLALLADIADDVRNRVGLLSQVLVSNVIHAEFPAVTLAAGLLDGFPRRQLARRRPP